MTTKLFVTILNNMMKTKQQLIALGMNDNEVDVYLSILKLKNATVTDISRDTEIKRTSIYYCLESLSEKGLIFRLVKNNNKYYYPENPAESLNNLISNKAILVKSILPELKTIFGANPGQPEIKVFRKIEGLRKMFLDPLNSKEKLIRYYLSNYYMEEILGQEFVDNFVKMRIEKKITSRTLRPLGYKAIRETGRSQIEQLREIRVIPESLIIKPYFIIYDNKVLVISSPEEKLGFIIESKDFADAQKAIFDFIWDNSAKISDL